MPKAINLCMLMVVLVLRAASASAATDSPPVWGVALDGNPISPRKLEDVRLQTGLPFGMVVFFVQWPPPGQQQNRSPLDSLKAITQAGALPCLTWEPMYLDEQGQEVMIPLGDVLNGAYDAYIKGFAKDLCNWGQPVVIRFAHEMNLARYHWGVAKEAYGPASPAAYREMFRYVVDRFRAEGASNALWAFCPNAESLPHPRWHRATWNQAANYYPGHNYVDILGMDGYNWGATRKKETHGWDSQWLSFRRIFQPLYNELKEIAPNKPMLVFETGCAALGGNRAQWLREAVAASSGWGFLGLNWFQVKKEVDWRLLRRQSPATVELLRQNCNFEEGALLKAIKDFLNHKDKDRR